MATNDKPEGVHAAFGRRLQAARIEAGFRTSSDIAAQVKRSARQVQNYELGNDMPPSDVLARWAEATGRPVSHFMEALQEPESADVGSCAHPGVTLLAADTALCDRHHVTLKELQQVSLLVTPWPLRTPEQALLAIELLRRIMPC